jgi:tRNA nucleotidyltransferase/poly(A) polymerase
VDHLSLKQILGYLVWLGCLPEPTLRSIAFRLRFKSNLKQLLIETSKINRELPKLIGAKPSEIVHALEKAPRLSLFAAYIVNKAPKFREPLWQFISQWADVTPHTTGDDLRDMGLRPSPAFGRILTALRDAWIDGEIQSKQEEEAMLKKLAAEIE